MARFGPSGDGGRTYFGGRDDVAAQTASATIRCNSVLVAVGRIAAFRSAILGGTSSLSAVAQVPVIPPVINSVNPTSPVEGEVGVVISGENLFGSTWTYGGQAVTVTNTSPTTATVTWPLLAIDSGQLTFSQDYALIGTTGAGSSAPFPIQTLPQAAYTYVLTATNTSGVKGVYDDSTYLVGTDYVYGIESPQDGGWDLSRADQGIFNGIPGLPDNATWTFRLWDQTTGEWSNQAVINLLEAVSNGVLLTGDSTLDSTWRQDFTVSASATIRCNSSLSAAGRLGIQASASMPGDSALQANGDTLERVAATLAGDSTLVAVSVGNKSASATLPGDSILTARPAITASAVLSGDSTLEGIPRAAAAVFASARFDGDSTFTGVLASGAKRSAIMDGSSGLTTGPPTITYKVAAILPGDSTLYALGRLPGQTIGPIDKPGIIQIQPRLGIVKTGSQLGIKGTGTNG